MLSTHVAVLSLLAGLAISAPDLEPHTCLTMDPFDSALPQTSPFPYQLLTSETGAIENHDSAIIILNSTDPNMKFERFIVHARDNDTGVAVGKFVDTGLNHIRLANCFGSPENTALELDSAPKHEVIMMWMPDLDYEGFITFYSTVVQTKEVFWLRQPSISLRVFKAVRAKGV